MPVTRNSFNEASVAACYRQIEHLFLSKEIACIQATTDIGNVASQKVLEKAGFQKEGIERKRFFYNGEWRDIVLFSILREEWKEPKILTKTH